MSKNLQALNSENKLALWASRISECRNSSQSVKEWCRENGVCEQTYYRWQRKLFEMTQAQQEATFVEVTAARPVSRNEIAAKIRIGNTEAEIYSGAEPTTIEAVLKVLKSC